MATRRAQILPELAVGEVQQKALPDGLGGTAAIAEEDGGLELLESRFRFAGLAGAPWLGRGGKSHGTQIARDQAGCQETGCLVSGPRACAGDRAGHARGEVRPSISFRNTTPAC